MKHMELNKKIDLLIISILLVIIVLVSLALSLKPLIVLLMYLLSASVYLSLRERKNFKKIFWAILIFGIIFGLGFDFVVTFNKGWIVNELFFPFRLFGFYPIIDDILGFILMTLFIVVFYEHFIDDEKNKKVSKNIKWILIVSIAALSFIFAVYLINSSLLRIPYAYLMTGLMAICFPIVFGIGRQRFMIKFLKTAGFSFIVWFVLELVCLKNSGWIFPGEYVGLVNIWGLRFPLEELFFWMMWYSVTIVSYYEFFIDDKL